MSRAMSPSAELAFRVLGPLEVDAGGERLRLGGARQRAALAVLLVSANEPVSTDRLIDALWGEHPPGTAKTALHGYITQLRRVLEPGRRKRAAGEVLVTTPAGYVLQVADGAFDRDRFERLAGEGREALSAGRATRAVELCRAALALWRGPALAEFAYEAWAQAEAERLEELRLTCLEEGIEADLRLGHYAELVPELEALVAEHPLRERPRAQLMLTLYRTGRQAEALELYQQTRRLLVEELGINPGAALQELEAAILRQDAELAAPPVRTLPEGTVTLLATDIEGSTRLLHELGVEHYAETLQEHRRLLREAFVRHGGVEVDTQGDAFLISFSTAPAAFSAAESALSSLSSGPIRVRIGLHTGAPIVTNEGYVGVDLHRVARIAAAGHGGQLLVSETTARLVDDADLRDLGEHRLKDLTAPVRLYQLGDEEFPPLKTLHQTNLPVQSTPLVGRTSELRAVRDLLARSRLVTLTGPGGSGKTRLALQAAAELPDNYPDGVWWVSLAALRDPGLVEPAIAQVVGAKGSLTDHLRSKQLLLLLDNFEHLLETCSRISALLSEAPGVQVLVTSRERLGLAAEHEYTVPTMVPVEAIALYTVRARQLTADFEPDDAVAEICRRLDGLPLAIELAAARVKVLRSDQILDRLAHSLDLLTSGSRDAPERHQTLRATIEWSYDLLDEDEQELFVRLGVFSGGCTLEAAEEVCGADIDTLQALVEKNLLRRTDEARFLMLETIKEFAEAGLDQSSRATETREAHAQLITVLARRAGNAQWGSEDTRVFEELAQEQDNVRAALTWMGTSGRFIDQLDLVAGVSEFWEARGAYREGLHWAGEALAGTLGIRSATRAAVLRWAGVFAGYVGDLEDANRYLQESLSIFRDCGTQDEIARALATLGVYATVSEDFEGASRFFEQALSESSCADPATRAFILGNQADLALQQGDYENALSTLAKALELQRELESERGIGWTLCNMAFCLFQLGREEDALAASREAVTRSTSVIDVSQLIGGFTLLGAISARRDDARTAAALLGFAGALIDQSAFIYRGAEAEVYRKTAEVVAQLIGEEEYAKEYARGESMTLSEAVEYALASLDKASARATQD
jgi:predicted ATPase/DNA-binding SARP family transcriptional activator